MCENCHGNSENAERQRITDLIKIQMLLVCLVSFICLVSILAAGCQTVNPDFATTTVFGLDTIIPSLCVYIDKDETLDDETKEIRIRAVLEFYEMVKEGNGGNHRKVTHE